MKIEGYTVDEILNLPVNDIEELVLINKPMVVSVGTAQVLGQFWVKHSRTLVVELAHIDGGGEGVLLAIQRIAKDICAKKNLEEMECLVYAVSCARPNMKLRAHLVKRGFEIKNVPHKGEVFYKVFDVSGT